MATARCRYCGENLLPNSRYCLGCGQLVLGSVEEAEPVRDGWERKPRERARPQTPSTPTPAEPAATHVQWPSQVEVTTSTGVRVVIGGDAVVGRKPEQTAANAGAQSIEIDDPSRSVSRVHLFLELGDGSLRARDAGSSNGSTLERGDRRIPIPSDAAVDVQPDDVLWVGDVRVDLAAAG